MPDYIEFDLILDRFAKIRLKDLPNLTNKPFTEGQSQPAGQQGPHLPVRQEPHLREPGHDEAGAHLLTGPSRKDANQIQKCMQF